MWQRAAPAVRARRRVVLGALLCVGVVAPGCSSSAAAECTALRGSLDAIEEPSAADAWEDIAAAQAQIAERQRLLAAGAAAGCDLP